jgi:hypothetical protein
VPRLQFDNEALTFIVREKSSRITIFEDRLRRKNKSKTWPRAPPNRRPFVIPSNWVLIVKRRIFGAHWPRLNRVRSKPESSDPKLNRRRSQAI